VTLISAGIKEHCWMLHQKGKKENMNKRGKTWSCFK